MDYTALVRDFRLVMDEFRTNGRDLAVDEPTNAASVFCVSTSPRCTPPPPPPLPPPEWDRRGILWSHQWRCGPGTPAAQRPTGGSQVHSRLYRAEGPLGSVLVVDPRPAGGGGGGSPPARPARAGRAVARKRNKQPNHCVFCKNNNELPCVYRSHILKDSQGRILCPILRVYTCPTCGANGDQAHTVKYCPQRQEADDRHVESLPLPGASPLTQTPPLPPPLLRPLGRPITKRAGCC